MAADIGSDSEVDAEEVGFFFFSAGLSGGPGGAEFNAKRTRVDSTDDGFPFYACAREDLAPTRAGSALAVQLRWLDPMHGDPLFAAVGAVPLEKARRGEFGGGGSADSEASGSAWEEVLLVNYDGKSLCAAGELVTAQLSYQDGAAAGVLEVSSESMEARGLAPICRRVGPGFTLVVAVDSNAMVKVVSWRLDTTPSVKRASSVGR